MPGLNYYDIDEKFVLMVTTQHIGANFLPSTSTTLPFRKAPALVAIYSINPLISSSDPAHPDWLMNDDMIDRRDDRRIDETRNRGTSLD